MSIILFLLILLVLVIAHEFGHFIAAKKSGIRVDEFAFGFPPRLFAKKWGETTYAFNAIPIGGYVKMHGEDNEVASDDPDAKRTFNAQHRVKQSIVVLAGIAANIVTAWLLFTIMLSFGMRTSVGGNTFGTISGVKVMTTEVLSDSPAAKAGIKPGDTLVALRDGTGESLTVTDPAQVTDFVSARAGKPVTLTVERKDGLHDIVAVPTKNPEAGDRPVIGIAMDEAGQLKLPIHLAIAEGAVKTYEYTTATTIGIVDFLKQVVTGRANFKEVSGPVGIVGAVGDAAQMGFMHVVFLAAILSINLAVINFIPFPALDGGRFLFILIEAVSRKKLPAKATTWVNTVGFAALMLLMVVVTYHDIVKLFH